MTINLTSAQLRRAAKLTDKIETMQRQLRKLLNPPPIAKAIETPAQPMKTKKRKMSAAHKLAIARGRAKYFANR